MGIILKVGLNCASMSGILRARQDCKEEGNWRGTLVYEVEVFNVLQCACLGWDKRE